MNQECKKPPSMTEMLKTVAFATMWQSPLA